MVGAVPGNEAQEVDRRRVEATPVLGGLGALEDSVRLTGLVVPEPTRVQNSTDPELCGTMQTLDDVLVSVADRGIRDVIVALVDVPVSDGAELATRELELDNHECRFVPHAAVLTVGSTIRVKNSDPLMHNAHFYGAARGNFALPSRGYTAGRTVKKPGMVVVKCDLHGWMQAFIRVDRHPFHAVTDETGHFRISEIPAGTYTLELWHEKLGRQEQSVHIATGETAEVEVEYSLAGK